MLAFFPRHLLLLLLPLLTYCTYIPSIPYKIDIQQGNVVTEEMVARLKPDMTRSQVRFTLGTPLIEDAFHKDRWDYIFHRALKGRLTEERKLTVFFKDDRLSHIQGDFPPPPAFSEPAPAFSTPEKTLEFPSQINNTDNEEADTQKTIDFLQENRNNFYKDNQ